MQYRKLGQSDIEATVIGLGTWAIGGDSQWGYSDDRTSIYAIQEAIDQGITLIDTAPAYGLGHSEEVVGKAIEGKRHDVVLASKCGLIWDKTEGCALLMHRDGVDVCRNLAADSIIEQVERTLKRLNTDYLDVLLTHWQAVPPNKTPIEETMSAMDRLIEQGKIRAVGACNVTPEQIRTYASCGKIAVIQQKYSMLDRTVEQNGVMDACEELGITFQAYSPLERGLLTGKVTMQTEAVGNAKKSLRFYAPEERRKVLAMLEEFKPLCEKYETSMASLVIAWTVARKPYMSVLCGARKPEQVSDNAAGGSLILEQEDLEKIDRMSAWATEAC
ncbi:MAG: aldo/keto reductase [Eubacterium sp.]|nr:aldo/keto reductase [Eubacterium sp.]